jgi:hypothetical protein
VLLLAGRTLLAGRALRRAHLVADQSRCHLPPLDVGAAIRAVPVRVVMPPR